MQEEQKKIADSIMKVFCLSIAWMGMGIVTYPLFVPLNGMQFGLSGGIIGLILCLPSLASIMFVPLINAYVNKMGIELVICCSGLLFGLTFVCMGFTALVTTSSAYLWISIITSIFAGVAIAGNIVGEQALLLRYSVKEEREKNLGLFRAASGLGGLLAPLFGSAMYAWGGYMAAFMSVGAVYWLITPVIYFRLYAARDKFFALKQDEFNEANERQGLLDEDADTADPSETLQKKDPLLKDLIIYKTVNFAFAALMIQTASFLYQSTLTNPMLSEIYGLEPEMSSLFYMIAGVGFILFTPIAFQLRSRKIMLRRSIIFMALCTMGVAMIIRTGDMRGNAKIYWVYIGQIVNGAALALLTTTTFPEIVDCIEKTKFYPNYDKDTIHVYTSSLFVLLSSTAQVLGTFFGSFTAEYIGYTWAFASGGFFMIFFAIIYAVVCGRGSFDEQQVEKQGDQNNLKDDQNPVQSQPLSDVELNPIRDSVKDGKNSKEETPRQYLSTQNGTSDDMSDEKKLIF